MSKQLPRPSKFPRPDAQLRLPILATIDVNIQPVGRKISPLIYGVNNEHSPARLQQLGATVNRLGGTPWSTFNGPIRATNSGDDYYFHNYDSIDNIPVDPAGFHQRTRGAGGTTMLTLPLLDKVARDTRSYAFSVRKYGPQTDVLEGDAGNGIKPGGAFVTNDPADAFISNTPALQETWLRSLPTTVPLFCLDNEPMLWHSSHRAAHPEGAKMQEVIAATRTYAAKVRQILPGADLLGPEEWNYEGCFTSGYDARRAEGLGYNQALYPDRRANGGQDWIPVYMSAMKEHFSKTGQRLINYLSLHFYPHTPTGETLLESSSNTPALQALRLRSTRSLWDPAYVSEDYIKDFSSPNNRIQLIPRMKAWASAFPGTKTALTEYSFGPDNLLASALAQVEALGVFGREGLDLACCWPSPDPKHLSGLAFRLFRNYDGKGGRFGELCQKVTLSGLAKDNVSAFAATSPDGRVLTVIAINQHPTAATATELRNPRLQLASLYQLTAGGLTRLPDQHPSAPGVITLTLPPLSATLFVAPL